MIPGPIPHETGMLSVLPVAFCTLRITHFYATFRINSHFLHFLTELRIPGRGKAGPEQELTGIQPAEGAKVTKVTESAVSDFLTFRTVKRPYS